MQLISKEIQWDMWHRVPNHSSKCKNLHGHRYRAEIIMRGDVIAEKWVSSEWMVIDFSHIKEIAGSFIDDKLDHGYMFQKWDIIGELVKSQDMKYVEVDFVPTAENIASFLYDSLKDQFKDVYWTSLELYQIRLWETPTSAVLYPFYS